MNKVKHSQEVSLLLLLLYGLVNIFLIRIKSGKPHQKEVIQIPVRVPYAGIILNLLLIFMSLLA